VRAWATSVHARPRGTGACAARSSSSCVQYAPPRLEPWPCPQHPRVRQHGACKGRRPAPAREATRAAPKPPKHSQSPAGPDGAPVHRAHARTRADAWPGHRASSAHEHSAPRRVLDPPPPLAIRMGGGGAPPAPPPWRHSTRARGVPSPAPCADGNGPLPHHLRAKSAMFQRCRHRPRSELDQGVRTDQAPSSTKVCAPTKLRARPSSEFDQGVRTDQGPSSTVRTDQGPSSTKFRVRPRCTHRPRSELNRAHRPRSELDQGPSRTVRTIQGPSSTKFRVRPRCAPRPRSQLDQGPSWTVRTDQGPNSTKVRVRPRCAPRPRSELDQGPSWTVRTVPGPSSTKVTDQGPRCTRLGRARTLVGVHTLVGAHTLVELGPWSVAHLGRARTLVGAHTVIELGPWSLRTPWSTPDLGRCALVELGHWSVRTLWSSSDLDRAQTTVGARALVELGPCSVRTGRAQTLVGAHTLVELGPWSVLEYSAPAPPAAPLGQHPWASTLVPPAMERVVALRYPGTVAFYERLGFEQRVERGHPGYTLLVQPGSARGVRLGGGRVAPRTERAVAGARGRCPECHCLVRR